MNAIKLSTLILAMVGSSMSFAGIAKDTSTIEQKAIIIADRGASIAPPVVLGTPVTQQAMQLRASTEKPVYAINEAIRLNILTNKDAYIYVLNELSGQTTLLLPNYKDQYHKVQANTFTTLPRNMPSLPEMYSDRAGTEQFLIIASKNPININQYLSQKNGPYVTGRSESLLNSFNAMGVRLGDAASANSSSADISFVRLSVPILNSSEPVQPALPVLSTASMNEPVAASSVHTDGSTLLLATNRSLYQLNDSVIVSYASNTNGVVNIAQVNAAGLITLISSQKTNAKLTQFQIPASTHLKSIVAWVSAQPDTRMNGLHQGLLPAGVATVDLTVVR